MIRTVVARTAVVCATAAALVASAPVGTADAHTRTQETTNLDSRITRDPQLPGVSFTVHTGGLLVEVRNDGDEVLEVAGYEGEPYLRIGPDGVERNRRSPATYLNDDRIGRRVSARVDVAMPRDVDASAPPEWIRLTDEPQVRWHDHRVHWMSPAPPRFVEAGALSRALMRVNLVGVIGRAGDDAGDFQAWSIPLTHGGTTTSLDGTMAWHDPPPAWPMLALAALAVAPAMLGVRRGTQRGVRRGTPRGVRRGTRRGSQARGQGRADARRAAMVRSAAVVVLAVASVNTIHLVDDLLAWPSDPLDELFGLLHTTLFLGTGIGGALWALRSSYGQVFALTIASAGVLYHQGLVHLPMLHASHFPTLWPPTLVRFTVALGLLQVVPVAVAVWCARRRADPRPQRDAPEAPVAPEASVGATSRDAPAVTAAGPTSDGSDDGARTRRGR